MCDGKQEPGRVISPSANSQLFRVTGRSGAGIGSRRLK